MKDFGDGQKCDQGLWPGWPCLLGPRPAAGSYSTFSLVTPCVRHAARRVRCTLARGKRRSHGAAAVGAKSRVPTRPCELQRLLASSQSGNGENTAMSLDPRNWTFHGDFNLAPLGYACRQPSASCKRLKRPNRRAVSALTSPLGSHPQLTPRGRATSGTPTYKF
jgi:hypothetical protein